MNDELESLRRVKKLAAQLVALDSEKERIVMDGKMRELGAVHARYHETWCLLKLELAA
jgi:hypothetical protein